MRIPEVRGRVQLLPGPYPMSDHRTVHSQGLLTVRLRDHLVALRGLACVGTVPVAVCTGVPESTSLLSSAFPAGVPLHLSHGEQWFPQL